MNEELKNLESELRDLIPTSCRNSILERMENELADPEQNPPCSNWFINSYKEIITGAIAASLGLLAGYLIFSTKPHTQNIASTKPTFNNKAIQEIPHITTQRFFKTVDEGIIHVSESTPTQQFKYHFIETKTWKKPEKSITLQHQQPREKIVRLAVQHY